MKSSKLLAAVLLLLLTLPACGPKTAEPETTALDLDFIAGTLTDSGYFSDPAEAQDPESVPGLLSLYEDRVEANPEDIAEARYTMSLGMADQFLLLQGTDSAATDRLEAALDTYLEDSRSALEFYLPEQVARLDEAVIERRGTYLLLAVGNGGDGLPELCKKLMDGETENLPTAPPAPEPPVQPVQPDSSVPDTSEPLTPLTQEELEAAHEAAHRYYAGTVFEDIVLTEIAPKAGEISFQVSCTKGGVRQDPDRTISLERQDGVWTVVNEGY